MIKEILMRNSIFEVCISKRNEVNIVQDDQGVKYVLKRMHDRTLLKNELELLQLLYENGVAVPCVIEVWEEYILLEYIEGPLYLEVFQEMEQGAALQVSRCQLVSLLLDWLDEFYKITCSQYGKDIIINDVNFRNFIMKDGKLYGVDMELCEPGRIESDLGKIAAFALMYYPEQTDWKKEYIQELMEQSACRFGIGKDVINSCYISELEILKKRRKKGR